MLRTVGRDEGHVSQIRRSIDQIPDDHRVMKNRILYGRTNSGIDFKLSVTEATTNGRAIKACDDRIAAAKEAKRLNMSLDAYLRGKEQELIKKTTVNMIFKVGSGENVESYNIAITHEGPGIYKVGKEYERGLKAAVQSVANQAEMRLAAINRQAENNVVFSRGPRM